MVVLYDILFWFQDRLEAIGLFMDTGGPVLWWIMVLTFACWALLLERLFFLQFRGRKVIRTLHAEWRQRSDKTSWYAVEIRDSLVAAAKYQCKKRSNIIATCVALCPLLGLLGTVTGMIEVFHVMAVTGGGDARQMAGGVSRATLPTMAGMVAAISGIMGSKYLEGRIRAVSNYIDQLFSSSGTVINSKHKQPEGNNEVPA